MDFRSSHEDVPEKTGTIVLDHADLRALVDGKESPYRLLSVNHRWVVGIIEAVFSEHLRTKVIIKMSDHSERFLRSIDD
jgi:hypothetical protein